MSTVLARPFAKMGARVKVRPASRFRMGPGLTAQPTVALDIGRDEEGEYFDVSVTGNPEISVLEVKPDDRHLVLMTKYPEAGTNNNQNRFVKSKFLCGHDERHWFVAAIPESASVTTVRQAKEALKPAPVLRREAAVGLPEKEKHRRKNAATKRQGEWFFIPVDIEPGFIRKNEPFNRGRGKFHYAEQAFRTGGRTVYVSGSKIMTPDQYNALTDEQRRKMRSARIMNEGATLYVRGRITHDDHKTLILDGWHEVAMNEESKARAMGFVRFLD